MVLLFLPLMIGTAEIVLLAGVALLLFGGKKLPEVMRNMGKGVKEFKEGVQGAPQDFQTGMNEGKQQDPQDNHAEPVNNKEKETAKQDEQ